MDAFASILSAEMAKKKSATAPKSTSTDTTAATKSDGTSKNGGSKYVRRADIEKARQEQYLADQARLESERAERALKKRKADEEAAAERERQLEKRQRLRDEKEKARLQKEQEEEEERKRKLREKTGATGDTDEDDESKKDGTGLMDESAAVRKLRELNEPIRLFGESNAQRMKRIHRLTGVRKATPPPLSGGELLIDPQNVAKDPSAWPIGVTMVGIHERSAREKLHEKGKSAHIMSDEATRKYLQSIKRCLNFAQTRWPPEDPMQIMG
ncbi:mRNA splicing protein prp18 [Orbilia oligospora]|uniref:Pre-mRNA-splicing factor 18 n=1 Tax=Orbilia oligospora TaxID=2813651 RepID=A0A7C8Q1M8_ORBOL|nr:mRNA splicing protein prp18 [Orbilia oligospora]